MRAERRVISKFFCLFMACACMLFFTACSDYLALFDDPRFFKQISSAEELFDTINDGIYKFENEIDVQTTTYDEFMDYWHELEGQMALHSAFREQDVKIRYSNKEEGVCKIRIIMELNACGQAMQYLYAKNVNKYPSKEAEKVGEKLLEIKETIVHDGMSDQDKVRAIHDFIISHYKYAVNGEILTSNEFGPNFFERMITLAREEYEVTIFSNVPFSPNSSKETVTFTTSDADEATIGAKNMYDNGYTVTISYDKKTGIYTCIAVK